MAEGMEIETSLNFQELYLKESAIPLFLLVFWLACWEMERRPWTMRGDESWNLELVEGGLAGPGSDSSVKVPFQPCDAHYGLTSEERILEL